MMRAARPNLGRMARTMHSGRAGGVFDCGADLAKPLNLHPLS
jgi:hypothetical protein